MNVVKTAYSAYDKDTCKEFGFNSYYMMMCDKCINREDEENKDDRNNNSK